MMSRESTPTQLHLSHEGSIVSSHQPLLAVQQARALVANFGVRRTLKTLIDKRLGEDDTITLELTVEELDHPLYLRQTHSDLCNVVDVFCRRTYDVPPELIRRIGTGAIVDIGAYNGTTPAYFASRYPEHPVLAIEPNPRNFPLLYTNASAYGDQIRPVHAAATPTQGQASMQRFGFATDSMQNAFLADLAGGNAHEAIDAITPHDILSSLENDKISILKVDIEGAEHPLFSSPAIDELLRQTGVLLVETHDQFMPHASEVVYHAATNNGLTAAHGNRHTEMYYRA